MNAASDDDTEVEDLVTCAAQIKRSGPPPLRHTKHVDGRTKYVNQAADQKQNEVRLHRLAPVDSMDDENHACADSKDDEHDASDWSEGRLVKLRHESNDETDRAHHTKHHKEDSPYN